MTNGRKKLRKRPPYLNRELSWLAFNRRVLEQAQNPKIPILERVKFLAIVSSNLDEFFEIRVAGIMQQAETNVVLLDPSLDGSGPRELLPLILQDAQKLVREQYACWTKEIVPTLAKNNVLIKSIGELSPKQLRWLEIYFTEQILPVLTPLAIDPSHPFPFLPNKTLNIAVSLNNPDQIEAQNLAIIPMPRILPRILPIPTFAKKKDKAIQTFIFLSEAIKHFASKLFPGCEIFHASAFRVTRNSDLYIDEEEAENLIQAIEEELRNLRRGDAVRLEIEESAPPEIYEPLCEYLNLDEDYVFKLKGPVNLSRLMELAEIKRPELKYPSFSPANASPLSEASRIFSILKKQDVFLHHPYDSFQPVVDFIDRAAKDPDVLAIKQTLYRTSGDSPFIRSLIEASNSGKQVTALVELKARGDEANNIQWARQLEEAGVHVVYGILGYKVHGKCALVVRKEGRTLRRYVHLGTGNYNPKTAKIYTDIGYFTSRPSITEDAAALFNTLTGMSRPPNFHSLLVAPYTLAKSILRLIQTETSNAKAGNPARIIAKMNALVEKDVIDALYAASQAGVKIDLIVRGICCLQPGVKGLSENIRVRSIVGRFLEHARIFYFLNHGKKPAIYAGSADWMQRNLHRRVEILYPISNPRAQRWITEDILDIELADNVAARELQADGSYLPVKTSSNEKALSAQIQFLESAKRRQDIHSHKLDKLR